MSFKHIKIGLVLLGVLLIVVFNSFKPSADDVLANYVRDSLSHVTQKVQFKICRARYMEEKAIAVKTDLVGWAGVPVTLFEYHVKDGKTNVVKTARVYMANAPAERIARWIVTACWKAKSAINEADINKLIGQIAGQSGGQFPVLGIVYEDMEGSGVHYPYLFKDGVTVYPKDFKPGNEALGDEQIHQCLSLTDSLLKPNTGKYTRICSTTREDYYQSGGVDSVGHSAAGQRSLMWLGKVRELYQQALKSDDNQLITMWAKSNL